MPSRLRSISLLLLAAVAALVLSACGGGNTKSQGKEASANTDARAVVKDTFSGAKQVNSAVVDLSIAVVTKGGPGAGAPVNVKVSGPFQGQGQGKGELPKLDMKATTSGSGQDIKVGVVSTGDKGFVSFNGTDYAVSDQVFKQFTASYEEAQKQSTGTKDKPQSLASLGIDPQKWLVDPKNEGEKKVGDTDVVKVSGRLDVIKLLDDVDSALAKAGSLGLGSSGQVPQKLTSEQRKQVTDAIKEPRVEIYTGAKDKILRRLVLATNVVSSGQTASLNLDLKLTGVNEDQKVTAPTKTKPFDQLLSQFGGLGALGALGGGGAAATPGASGAGSAGSQKKLQEYTDCVTKAGSDAAKAQKCADLLKP